VATVAVTTVDQLSSHVSKEHPPNHLAATMTSPLLILVMERFSMALVSPSDVLNIASTIRWPPSVAHYRTMLHIPSAPIEEIMVQEHDQLLVVWLILVWIILPTLSLTI
jgi:hypothetical protein